MLLRLTTLFAASIMAMMAIFVTAQISLAQEEPVQEEPTREVAANSVGYNCIIPRFGSTQCGPQFYVGRGRTVSVYLNTSGGKRVDFTTYDVGTGQMYGATRYLYPGQRKSMWTNKTRSGQYVYVRASSPAEVRVQAVGKYGR